MHITDFECPSQDSVEILQRRIIKHINIRQFILQFLMPTFNSLYYSFEKTGFYIHLYTIWKVPFYDTVIHIVIVFKSVPMHSQQESWTRPDKTMTLQRLPVCKGLPRHGQVKVFEGILYLVQVVFLRVLEGVVSERRIVVVIPVVCQVPKVIKLGDKPFLSL